MDISPEGRWFMSRALAALALAFALGGGPPLQWAAGLVNAVLSASTQADYGSSWDPDGSESGSDYGNHFDPNG